MSVCPLRPSELRALQLLAAGASYKQAALSLGLSSSTIRTEVHTALGRLCVSSSLQAILRCRCCLPCVIPCDCEGLDLTAPVPDLLRALPPGAGAYLDAFDAATHGEHSTRLAEAREDLIGDILAGRTRSRQKLRNEALATLIASLTDD